MEIREIYSRRRPIKKSTLEWTLKGFFYIIVSLKKLYSAKKFQMPTENLKATEIAFQYRFCFLQNFVLRN